MAASGSDTDSSYEEDVSSGSEEEDEIQIGVAGRPNIRASIGSAPYMFEPYRTEEPEPAEGATGASATPTESESETQIDRLQHNEWYFCSVRFI